MAKKIIIIGGGISGLSAGIYAKMYGYDTLIVEKNHNLGGLCTAWDRKGMHIDGCIHWLTGTKENTSINKLWHQIGAFKQEDILYLPTWGAFDYEGTVVHFYTDLEKAEKEWVEISPKDKREIHHFFKMVNRIKYVDLPLDAFATHLPLRVSLRFVGQLTKVFPTYLLSMITSCETYAKRFKHPALRWAISHAQPGAGNLYSMLYCYGTLASGNGGLPKGGSLSLVNNLVNKYTSLGGEYISNAEVVSIDVKNEKVESITLKNGTKISGDNYISCCDSNYVLSNLLNNKYTYKKLAERFNNPKRHPAPSAVLINYEIPSDVNINIPTNFRCEEYDIANKRLDYVTVRPFNYDPYFIKDGKTVLQVLIDQDSNDFDYWYEMYEDQKKYRSFKAEFAAKIQNLIENHFPELKGKMTLLDVATPYTLNRYVNASRGSYMSFLFHSKKGTLATRGKVHGIKNILLSGQYVQTPGGLPLAMASGKFSVDWLKRHKR